MATLSTPQAQPAAPPSATSHENASPTALVPAPPQEKRLEGRIEGSIARLPVELDVAVPIREFRLRNLLSLSPGAVIASQWVHTDDLPVLSGQHPLAWSEFEVVDTHLAVRLTRLP
ncbi:FliM/FliN family flagellar motor switch protein [Acidobacteria bacterium AB60]|nr:FliM/FliN family flagellar motor switch protein [Acidobacteria bacterium AB60]